MEDGHNVRYDRIGAKALDTFHEVDREKRFLTGMISELRTLAQTFAVVVVEPIPEAGWSVPQLAAKMAYFNRQNEFILSTDYFAYTRRSAPVVKALDSLESTRLIRVRPQDVLCNQIAPGRCLNATGTEAYYIDNNHLSRTATRMLAPSIVVAVRDGLERHSSGR